MVGGHERLSQKTSASGETVDAKDGIFPGDMAFGPVSHVSFLPMQKDGLTSISTHDMLRSDSWERFLGSSVNPVGEEQ